MGLGLGLSFWVTFLIQVVLGGSGSAIVGYLAVRVLKGMGRDMFGEQQRTTNAAEAAASRASEAVDASQQAARHASTAGDNSRQANDAIEWLATELAKRDVAEADMKERIDRLLGTRARQLAAEQPPLTGGLLIPRAAADDDDPATVTGRHRLHTQRITTFDDGDFE